MGWIYDITKGFDEKELQMADPIVVVMADMKLSVADQRKVIENQYGAPCFRMWLHPAEAASKVYEGDWTAHPLPNGRVAVWRREHDVELLIGAGEHKLAAAINERRMSDAET